MKAFAASIAAAALAAPAPALAEPRDRFCIELDRLLRTAERGGDFVMLQRSKAAPPRLGFDHCFPAAGSRPSWYCHQTLAPEHLSLESLTGRTAACVPEAVRSTGRYGRQAIFTLPHARISIDERGGPRAKVGRIASFRVEALRP